MSQNNDPYVAAGSLEVLATVMAGLLMQLSPADVADTLEEFDQRVTEIIDQIREDPVHTWAGFRRGKKVAPIR